MPTIVHETAGLVVAYINRLHSFLPVVPNLFSVMDPFDDFSESCGPP